MKRRYKNIDYILKRSGRKTACIQIDRTGCISIRVPNRTTIRQIEGLIGEKESWINRTLALWEERNSHRLQRLYVDGETLSYMGKDYTLAITPNQVLPLVLNPDGFQLSAEYSRPSCAREVFIAFYLERGLRVIGPRVDFFQGLMGVEAKKIRMSKAKTRWASCSSKGTLRFAWRCLMLPPSVLDYIVVHELAHLVHMNHSPLFWSQVEKILPDYKRHYKWLRVNEANTGL